MEFKICESDFKFMCVIWDNEPLSSRNLVELCNKKLGWKKSTTYTTLKKLCEKAMPKMKTQSFHQSLQKKTCRLTEAKA